MPEVKKIPFLQLLLKAPKEYRINIVDHYPTPDRENLLKVEVTDFRDYGGKLFLKLKTESQKILNCAIFQASNYHRREFALGNRLYVRGKVVNHLTYGLSINQPSVTDTPDGTIKPIYRDSGMADLIKEHLTAENIRDSGLPLNVSEQLYRIHLQPDEAIGRHIQLHKQLDPPALQALKFTELYYYIKSMRDRTKPQNSMEKLYGKHLSWIETLPFQLTGDQLKVIDEVAEDLSGDIASRRVVVGDVGSGKTIVILASIVMAYPHRTVVMAPTTLLANQLYEEAQKFLPDEYKIALVLGKGKKSDNLLDYDILIGTHSLLYREIGEAPLLIVDEQHRFGTVHRKKLQDLTQREESAPHFLQFSATPIPRTQAMINSEFVKVSLIEETPFKKNIYTKTLYGRNFPELLKHIESEIEKGHQIAIVYPLVEESETINYQSLEEGKEYWLENFRDVYVTHGKDREKESVLAEFRDNGSILLSTTVIEVGISLPKLTTIVIVGAERLGLATLHQLRGRVSRTGLQGYCFLFTKSNDEKATNRLKLFEETKSGFDIASLDLKSRRGGDIVEGVKQSGESFKWFNIVDDIDTISAVRSYLSQPNKAHNVD